MVVEAEICRNQVRIGSSSRLSVEYQQVVSILIVHVLEAVQIFCVGEQMIPELLLLASLLLLSKVSHFLIYKAEF